MMEVRTSGDDFNCEQVVSGRVEVDRVRETASVLAFRHTRPSFCGSHRRDPDEPRAASARQLQDCRAFATARGLEIAVDRRLRGVVLSVAGLDR